MECERASGWMMEAMDGSLGSTEEEALQAHLVHCAACRAEWERLQAVERILREAPMIRPPAGFYGRVLGQLDWRRRVRRVMLGGAALMAGTAACSLLVLISTAWLLSEPTGVLTVARTEGILLSRLADAAYTVLNSLLLTVSALIPFVMTLGLCGVVVAAIVGLAWLGLLRRLQPVAVARR